MFSKIEFGSKHEGNPITKHRHHNWSQKVERNNEGNILKGNYVGALCLICNINVTEKQNILPRFARFSGRYDTKFLSQGIKNQETYIISKPGDKFAFVKVTEKSDKHRKFSLNFVDGFNFLSTSIEKLVESIKKSNHNFKIDDTCLKKAGLHR